MAPSAWAIVTCAASPFTVDRAAAAGDLDRVVAGSAVDDHLIGLRRRRCWCQPPPDRSQPALMSVPVRSLTVMVSAPPMALSWMCSTPLRSMVTLPTSRNSLHARAVGRDVDVLVGVGAVEHQRVGAGLAFDHVAAVAGVPDELVVAVAHEARRRCRAPPVIDVVAGAADQHVCAGTADDGVVAVAGVDREVRSRRRPAPTHRWCRCRRSR